jgi:hypothetical protein
LRARHLFAIERCDDAVFCAVVVKVVGHSLSPLPTIEAPERASYSMHSEPMGVVWRAEWPGVL